MIRSCTCTYLYLRLFLEYYYSVLDHRAGASGKAANAAKVLGLPISDHQVLVKIIITGNGRSKSQDLS